MPISLMRVRHLVGGVAAGAALVLGTGLVSASTASAATPAQFTSAHATAKQQNCAILVAPVRPHQSTSQVLKSICSTGQANPLARPKAIPATDVRVFTLYEYTNYTGKTATYWGAPCSPTHWYEPAVAQQSGWGASSWRAGGSCWATTLYYGQNYGLPKYQYAQGVWEAAQIGAPWNNHVWSFWTGYSR